MYGDKPLQFWTAPLDLQLTAYISLTLTPNNPTWNVVWPFSFTRDHRSALITYWLLQQTNRYTTSATAIHIMTNAGIAVKTMCNASDTPGGGYRPVSYIFRKNIFTRNICLYLASFRSYNRFKDDYFKMALQYNNATHLELEGHSVECIYLR